jgi:hypothetical protein
MRIKTRLNESDFVYITFVLLFAKPVMKIVYIIMALAFLLAIVSAMIPSTIAGDFSISRLVFPLFVLVFLPASTYFAAKRNYASYKRIDEVIEYDFDKNYLIIKGESFNSQMTWNKIYRVSQTKRWLLIWQSKHMVNAIHKSDLPTGVLTELRQILMAQGVKNNIKES